MNLSVPPSGCLGIRATGLNVKTLPGARTYADGTVDSPAMDLVGTWDGNIFESTKEPVPTVLHTPAVDTFLSCAAREASPSDVVAISDRIAGDFAALRARGIDVLSSGPCGDVVLVTVVVADDATLRYLRQTYTRADVRGWLQRVD